MDYEKKYKDLYLRLKKVFNTTKSQEVIDMLFDNFREELYESEDERIRKYFVWIVKNVLDNIQALKLSNEQTRELIENYDGIKVSDMLAWLEKQQEQKPAENTCGACCGDEHFEIIAQARKDIVEKTNIAENELSMELPLLDGILLRVWQVGWLNKKPAEWGEEDNIGWDEAFACVTRAEKAAKNEEELQNAVTAEKWLKEIKFKYYVHPVKQEWSKEDEKIMQTMIKDGDLKPSEIAWLKSLRPSKDCSDCAKHLEGYISGRSDAENKLLEQFGALITPEDELHIKPRWKPSKEQMEALRLAIPIVKNCISGMVDHAEILESLDSDLTKIKDI